MRTRARNVVLFVVVVICILLVLSVLLLRKPLAIEYHKMMITAAWDKIVEVGPNRNQNRHISVYEEHRDALVRLGYFERKEFPLSNITVPSIQSRRLWEEICLTLGKYDRHVTMQGYEPNTPDVIVVWDQHEKIYKWEQLIAAHDASPSHVVTGLWQGQSQDVSAFVGNWGGEDGQICYVISKDEKDYLAIEDPQEKGYRTVFKNAHFEGNRIVLDIFHYFDPNENFKTIVDKSGQHSFSGVRCRTTFEVNPDNPDELVETISTIHTKEPITGTLSRSH